MIKNNLNNLSLGILTPSDYESDYESVKRLKQEAKKLGVRIEEIFIGQTSLAIGNHGKLFFRYHKNNFVLPKVIISRIGSTVSSYALYVLNQLTRIKGVKVINKIDGVAIARDKFRTLQALADHGYIVPKSMLVGAKIDLAWAIDQVGGFPVIMKLNKGTFGIGVMIAESIGGAKSVIETLTKLNQKVMIQQYLSSEPGTDYRIITIGKKYIAGMKRKAISKGEFRANLAQGGKGTNFNPSSELIKRSERISKLLNLDIAGIDFIYNNKLGYIPIEVNANPGLTGIEKATGKNIAKEIITFSLKLPNK